MKHGGYLATVEYLAGLVTAKISANKIISDLWFSTARCGFGGWVSTRAPYLAAPSTAPAIPIPALACLPWGLGLLHSWDTRQPAVPFGGPSRTATPQAANRVCSLTQSYFVRFSQSWTLVCFSRTENCKVCAIYFSVIFSTSMAHLMVSLLWCCCISERKQ